MSIIDLNTLLNNEITIQNMSLLTYIKKYKFVFYGETASLQ